MEAINIVWIKRDIRSQDHEPLSLAVQSGIPFLILYIFEPSLITYPDTSLRHLQFQYHSLKALNLKLVEYSLCVQVCYGEALEVLSSVGRNYQIQNIFSYRESGILYTYQRDLGVKKFCKENNIQWHESQRDGILRGLQNRKGWDAQWFGTMHSPLIQNVYNNCKSIAWENTFILPYDLYSQLENYPENYQPPGEQNAWKYLHSFLHQRVTQYSKGISKPLLSRKSCSRVSPYISWGNLSIKQVYQATLEAKAHAHHHFAISNFMTRLKWHCHFIQKFEVECSYETKCINHGYELLQHHKNNDYIKAWKCGSTGFPLIDACMRCLHSTGWINFRMRAMLVSFFCHHLYQDWREAHYHLAQLFLDYEPGIHYPQIQMQAGTTGINIVRMYNPVKQSMDHDPDGKFIKQWIPELINIPITHIHEPHKLSILEQELYGTRIGIDYPTPIVDIEKAGKFAREKIWGHRSHQLVQEENIRLLYTHTRRENSTENDTN